MKIFFVTDNRAWFEKIYYWRIGRQETVNIFCSPKGEGLFREELKEGKISSLNLKSGYEELLGSYKVGFSCHCKQIFPVELVEKIPCFNVHPGLNPYNRGWFPQVFSIINGLPAGATIHKMDKRIDHGSIVVQKEVSILESDTSKKVYDKIINAEFFLFDRYIENIIIGKYNCFEPENEGNYNSIADFKELCEINLDKVVTLRDAINYLRAMTFEGYDNAYFYDKNGCKVYVSINMNSED